MQSSKIVGTGPVDPVVFELLRPFGEIVIAPDPSEATMLPLLEKAIGLVVRGGGSATGRMIRAARDLRVIGRSGVGYETVDIGAANECGIPVVYAPGVGARAVAEAAVTFMLALSKRLVYWDTQLKADNWQSRFQSRPGDLEGATLGIVGLGNIGQHLAQLAHAFRMNILAYDPYASPQKAAELHVELETLENLLRRSDFISIHAPLTPETKGLINRERLNSVKRGTYLVNLSRGGLVESLDVIYEALQDGRLAGVGLDVFEPEPPDVSHPIFRLQNCLASPHALATTEGAMRQIFRSMAEDMAAVLRGEMPRFVVNPETLADRAFATVSVNDHDKHT